VARYFYDGPRMRYFYDGSGVAEVVQCEKLPLADHAAPARILIIHMSLHSLRQSGPFLVISLALLCGCEHRPNPSLEATFVWERDFEVHSPLLKKVGWYFPITNMSVLNETIATPTFDPVETLSPCHAKTVKIYFNKNHQLDYFPFSLRCNGQYEGRFEIPYNGPFTTVHNRFIVYLKSDGSIEVKCIEEDVVIVKKRDGSIELKSPKHEEPK
jgi:hypothetical protein